MVVSAKNPVGSEKVVAEKFLITDCTCPGGKGHRATCVHLSGASVWNGLEYVLQAVAWGMFSKQSIGGMFSKQSIGGMFSKLWIGGMFSKQWIGVCSPSNGLWVCFPSTGLGYVFQAMDWGMFSKQWIRGMFSGIGNTVGDLPKYFHSAKLPSYRTSS